jgi:hypothetical protein
VRPQGVVERRPVRRARLRANGFLTVLRDSPPQMQSRKALELRSQARRLDDQAAAATDEVVRAQLVTLSQDLLAWAAEIDQFWLDAVAAPQTA